MESHNCGSCGEILTDGVRCTVCSQDLHFHCAGITEAGFRKLGDRKLSWRCGKCKQSGMNSTLAPSSPRIEPDSLVLKEIKALAEKLEPLESLRDEVVRLRKEFAELKSAVDDNTKEMKAFNTRISLVESRLVQVEKSQSQIDQIKIRLDQMEQEMNSSEQWARMNNVEIKGVPQTARENLFDILAKIGSKIEYPVTKSQINFITRVPTREKDRTKPIVVCFCNRYVKEDFIAAARLVSKSNPITASLIGFSENHRIYVNDHLTVHNKVFWRRLRKRLVK
ncbi:uncharacterized protein LOC113508714 [Trichoplusia ni]|uniref:Uncharacterized protein LOC113508714 n=1 Tax=Trichoplusia ni TaxID=7111 RepID=A0A7E5X306_TRINI|nr:uncharacterized protein LOC113508714 [Trichoplusia ni]